MNRWGRCGLVAVRALRALGPDAHGAETGPAATKPAPRLEIRADAPHDWQAIDGFGGSLASS